MERNTRDAELSETPQVHLGEPACLLRPREDATAEDELSALANIYKFVLERHKGHKKDTGTERGESTHGVPRAKSGIRRQGMMSSDGHLERVLARLDGVEKGNGYFRAHCPAHDDHNPSLYVKEVEENGQRKVLLRCFAGCDKERILEELGLEWRDLYSKQGSSGSEKSSHMVATYNYTDASGNLLHQTVRYEPKRFSQRRPDGKGGWEWSLKGIEPVLYCLPDVMRAVLDGKTVFLVEGEKDADHAREELGITATTSPMGAKEWRDSYTTTLRGADVVLIPDNDAAGRNHMLEVGKSLMGVAASVRVLTLPDLPEKRDLSDWLDAGGTPEIFGALVENAPEFDSGHIGKGFGPNESLPVKTVAEIVAESGDGPDWAVDSLLAKGNVTDLSGRAKTPPRRVPGTA